VSVTRIDSRTRRTAAAIRRILNEDWDPLGAATPPDEYEAFVWPLYRLIAQRDCAAVKEYLQRAGEDLLQCGARDDRLDAIAQKLAALADEPPEHALTGDPH
jgi:hypothetical protein